MKKAQLNLFLMVGLALLGGADLFAQGPTPLLTKDAKQWIAILKSNAPLKDKMDACRELSVIGGQSAVAPLAALLDDEKLSHMARYGLEPNPDPAVDEAFRKALSRLHGRPLVGVIGSIGVRRDKQAVPLLVPLLHSANPEVVQAAGRSLGSIGTVSAAKALQGALDQAVTANQLGICEGLFRCAETLAKTGQQSVALEIYDRMRQLEAPHQVRGGALRGALLTRQAAGLPLLRESLRSEDYILFSAAVQAAQEMTWGGVTPALTDALDQLPPDRAMLVIQTLGVRADADAVPALAAAARKGNKRVRLEAIKSLPMIGHPSTLPVLVSLTADADADIAGTAKESLASLPGPKTDAAVLDLLKTGSTRQQVTAIELIERRRMTQAIGTLLQAARGTNTQVRLAAIKSAGNLGGAGDVPVLLEVYAGLTRQADLDAAEQALTSLCAKAAPTAGATKQVIAALAHTKASRKGALLRVLSAVGGTDALKAVSSAVTDQKAEVRAAAIRALGSWKTADAAPDLLALARSSSNATDKTLCLRSYLGLAANPDFPANERLKMCRQATPLLKRSAEKKMLLSALGGIQSPAALNLILPHLRDAATKEEAAAAVVNIADRLLKRKDASKVAAKLIEPLNQVAQTSGNADRVKRAKALSRQAKSKAGK